MGFIKSQKSRLGISLGRMALALLVPLLLLLLLEAGLHLFGYGHPTSFFIPAANGDLLSNPRYGHRFFDPVLSRPPLPMRLQPRKPAGTVRIFVLGASAIRGEPDPAFGPVRVLEAMLSLTFPDRRFEVINTGMTAVNSHAVLPVARQCAKLDGDLAVVYLGNNEVVGPWGIASVIGRPAPRRLICISVQLRATRVGQLFGDLKHALGGEPDLEAWQGMAMFTRNPVPANDPRLSGVRADLQTNLERICTAFTDQDIPVVLSTVAVNLKDQTPLLSLKADEDAAGLFANGRELMADGQHERGAADLVRARDLDALRFRADSATNSIIREVAHSLANVHLADAEFELGPAPGARDFHEHVHLTFAGAYRLAAVLFEQVAPLVEAEPGVPPTRLECADWLGRTLYDQWHARRVVLAITGGPPFSLAQAKADTLLAEAAWQRMKRVDAGQTVRRVSGILARRPHDMVLRERLAELHFFLGHDDSLDQQWSRLLEYYPLSADWWVNRAQVQAAAGRLAEAVDDLHQALDIDPNHLAARALLNEAEGRVKP